ncbi:MAG: zf-HC2 domain-containing protein [Myxococcales bacterium]|nr:zf-HC2 domain-containing protein [Myxococcales bacterium]
MRARARLSAYLDSELSPAWRRAVHGHLLTCAACKAMASELAQLQRGLRELPAPDVPAGLFARIEKTLAEQDIAHSERRAWRYHLQSWLQALASSRGLRVSGAFAAASLAAIVVGTLHQRGPSAPASPRQPAPAAPQEALVATSLLGDEEASDAYLEVVGELRSALRRQLRLGHAADEATWRAVSVQLASYEQAFARATTPRERRELASATAAYLGEALAASRTNDLIARSSW